MKITPIKTLTPINESYLKHEFNAELARGLPFLALICFTMQLNEHIIQKGRKKKLRSLKKCFLQKMELFS